jgi:ribosomal protein S18 acetylase RimI-like enzyme
MIGRGILQNIVQREVAMKLSQYPYLGEVDKYKMFTLAREFAPVNLHVIDLPYRLSSWALDDPENIRLWFDEHEQLMGWAVLQSPFWTIDYVFHPQVEVQLHPEILAWADQRARTVRNSSFARSAWFAMVFDEQKDRIRVLEEAGFQCQADIGEDSWSKVLMCRSDPNPVKRYAPRSKGFIVRPLAGAAEVGAYVELQREVFGSKNMTTEWRLRTLKHPAYKPDLDLVVEAPDGRLAAFCICWFDERSGDGHVEPLGCHEDFRQYALGRVVLSEGLQRLQACGAKNIFIETDNYRNTAFRLYTSFGFEVIKNVLVYRKNYEE